MQRAEPSHSRQSSFFLPCLQMRAIALHFLHLDFGSWCSQIVGCGPRRALSTSDPPWAIGGWAAPPTRPTEPTFCDLYISYIGFCVCTTPVAGGGGTPGGSGGGSPGPCPPSGSVAMLWATTISSPLVAIAPALTGVRARARCLGLNGSLVSVVSLGS